MPNTANAEWNGNLKEGRGHFSTGSLEGDFTFKSRFEGENDVGANPEQLIAAAHASCFSMHLSNELSQHGHELESVKTTVDVTVKMVDERAHHHQGRHQHGRQGAGHRRRALRRARGGGQEGLHRLARTGRRRRDHAGDRLRG